MISNLDHHITSNKITWIIKELNKYKNPDKLDILYNSIENRLDQCLKEYYSKLNNAFDKLDYYNDRHNINMMKKLNKD